VKVQNSKKKKLFGYFCTNTSGHLDLFSALYAIEFCSLASGSSGNCYYVGHHDGALLIDAGISLRRIEKSLRAFGRDVHNVKGVLLTHNHIDHIAGLELLAEKYTFNIYASRQVAEAMREYYDQDRRLVQALVEVVPGKSFVTAGFSVTAFEVDHDAPGTLGFHVRNSNTSLAIATDLGHIGRFAHALLPLAEVLILEANYDSLMLETGPYPPYLRHRISSNSGHLGNHQAAEFVARHCRTRLKHLFLAHLSKENNHPEKVTEAFESAFEKFKFSRSRLETLVCLDRTKRSGLYRF
jgi:phosphoribosyl 1,2-cyclic phosphodiesterase